MKRMSGRMKPNTESARPSENRPAEAQRQPPRGESRKTIKPGFMQRFFLHFLKSVHDSLLTIRARISYALKPL